MKPTNYGMGGGGDEQIQTQFLLSRWYEAGGDNVVWVVVGTRWYRPSFFFPCDIEVLHSVTKPIILMN